MKTNCACVDRNRLCRECRPATNPCCKPSLLVVKGLVSRLVVDREWECTCALCGQPWLYNKITGRMRRAPAAAGVKAGA